MKTPEDTLKAFVDLQEEVSSQLGKMYIALTVKSILTGIEIALQTSGSEILDEGEFPDEQKLEHGKDVARYLASAVNADPVMYFCSSEMGDLVKYSASIVDNTDIFDEKYIPSPNGFCLFEKGMKIHDSIIVHGIHWFTEDEVLTFVFFNDGYEERDGLSTKHPVSAKGRWAGNYYSLIKPGDPMTSQDVKMSSEEIAKYYDGDNPNLDLNPRSIVYSLFLLMEQKNLVDSSQSVSTKHKKRISILKKKKIANKVNVIKLRRTNFSQQSNERGGTVEYSHRWFVTGHWRWQPYKNKETNEIEHKRIWIHPYIKGPDDKPLKDTPKVLALVR